LTRGNEQCNEDLRRRRAPHVHELLNSFLEVSPAEGEQVKRLGTICSAVEPFRHWIITRRHLPTLCQFDRSWNTARESASGNSSVDLLNPPSSHLPATRQAYSP